MKANETTAVIVGLGQIGGSLAMALKKANFFRGVGGWDINSDRLKKARGFLDFACDQASQALLQGDLIILAAPIQQNMKFLDLASKTQPDKLYTDVGSTKQAMIDHAREIGVDRYIPGHPLTGSEKEGDAGWNESLFAGKPYYWVGADRHKSEDVKLILEMIQAIGAIPRQVLAQQHDQFLALTSHLPLLISAGLMETLSGQDPMIADFIGGGFRSAARLAGGSPEMARDIILTNRSSVLQAVGDLIRHLTRLQEDIRLDSEDKIIEMLRNAQVSYLRLVPTPDEDG